MSVLQKGEGEKEVGWGAEKKGTGKEKNPHMIEGLINVNGLAEKA